MKKFTNIEIICIAIALVLLLCLFPLPYGFFVLVRFATMVSMGYVAYHFYSINRTSIAIAAGVLALLFQPFAKIALGREVWNIVDVVVAVLLVVFIIYERKHPTPEQSVSASPSNNPFVSYDVFISYATKDYFDNRGNVIPGNVVLNVQNALTNAGISYWIDKKRLIGGTQFPTEIARQIKNAKVFLYISSANSNASNWTMNEIATANTYGKTIIPLLADHTPYNPSIMIYIAGIHYIDYASNPNRALNDMVHAIKAQIP